MSLVLLHRCSLFAALALLLSGCVGGPLRGDAREVTASIPPPRPASTHPAGDAGEPAGARPPPAPQAMEQVGSGRLINPAPAPAPAAGAGDVSLNFEDTDLRKVMAATLGEVLGESYVIDPAVKGTVTVRTGKPMSRDALIPVLEELLRMNGAALVRSAGMYQVVPLEQAARAAPPAATGTAAPAARAGFTVQVIPLRFASAAQVLKILEPYVPTGGSLRAVADRNVLVLSAPGGEIADFLATLQVFDADWLAGMSLGMYPLRFADAEQVAGELGALLGEGSDSPLAGMVRLFPIRRLNALLVVTPQERYLDAVKTWLAQLDRGGGGSSRRKLFVYDLENGRADHVARLLAEVFGETDAAPVARPSAELAPGLEPVTLSSPPSPSLPPTAAAPAAESGKAGAAAAAPEPAAPRRAAAAAKAPGEEPAGAVRFIPDAVNNALLVMATPEEWEIIEPAVRRLDKLPRQVLVEATIAEVTLNDNLSYGVQWFIKGGLGGYGVEFRSTTGATANLPSASSPGLSAAVFKSLGDVRIFIEALQAASEVRVLSSPQVLVTDNQTANIRVGTQVPVTTRRSTSAATGDAVVQEIEYRDTGVLLTVTPRINAGGIVSMEVSQEVSQVGPVLGATGNVSVDQRAIDSFVSVRSGETIVLGGLMTERRTDSRTGIPILGQLPVIGALFGKTNDDVQRTELLVLITPRVVSNDEEAREVTEELRRRLSRPAALK